MAEELRFFARLGLYALIAGTVYWFLTYETAGSLLLAFLVAGTGLFILSIAPLAGEHSDGGSGPIHRALNTVGFDDPMEQHATPLDLEDAPLPPLSVWPLALSVAAALVGLGLLYGWWFFIPGVGLGALAAWGWTTELV